MASHIKYFGRLLVLLALSASSIARAYDCFTEASIIVGPFNSSSVEYSEDSIVTSGSVVVHSGVSVIFSAPTIQLTPGFSAVTGSTFRALPGPVDCANPNLIAGIVNDGDGNPLDAVPICLDESSNSGSCARSSVTDSTGGYLFTNVVQNLPYRVTVDVSNDSNPYPNYAWAPLGKR